LELCVYIKESNGYKKNCDRLHGLHDLDGPAPLDWLRLRRSPNAWLASRDANRYDTSLCFVRVVPRSILTLLVAIQ
jgi:hypothetical protein